MPESKIKYTGDQRPDGDVVHHFPGIPARDLLAEEYAALDAELRKLVREGGIYAYEEYRKVAQRKDAKSDKVEAKADPVATDTLGAPKEDAPSSR